MVDGVTRALAATAAITLGVLATSCGSDETERTEGSRNEPVGSTSESSPFRVGHEPTGYRLVQAGRGNISQEWGEDSTGTDEPVTVLAPPGESPGGPEEVRVSSTGFEGYQGDLAQASRGYLSDRLEDFELDGQPAIYMPASEDEGEAEPADLVTVVGDDLAVRVSAADATRDELADIAAAVQPQDDHLLAPLVSDPPGDLEVVGSADADVAVSLLTRPVAASESVPSGERAHTAVWARGETTEAWSSDETVVVTTLPGTALDLDAVAASLPHYRVDDRTTVTPSEVAGRPAAVLDLAAQEAASNALRAVITWTAEEDLLLVVSHDQEPPDVDELIEVAASVETAEAQEWDDFVLTARGGPGLHPDPGAVELERGSFGDIDWLFQARVDADSGLGMESSDDEDTTEQFLADACLKLSTDERVCASSISETVGGNLTIETHQPYRGAEEGSSEPPGFVVVMTTGAATTARLHVDDAEVMDTTLHPLPGDRRRAGIFMGVDTDDLFFPDCIGPGEPVEPGTLELLDDDLRLPCST